MFSASKQDRKGSRSKPASKGQRRPGGFGRAWRLVRRAFVLSAGGVLGAAVAYFWDPDHGHTRRARQADQLRAGMRRQQSAAEGQLRYVGGRLKGASQAARTAIVDDGGAPVGDRVVTERVRSQVLGQPEFASLVVNVDTLDGVVTLRGEVPDNGGIQALTDAVSTVAGVDEVHSYLHLSRTSAPNKAEAIRKS